MWETRSAVSSGMGAVVDAALVVDLSVPETVPSWDPGWELVRLANRDQILADAPVHIAHPTAGEHRRASRTPRRTTTPR